MADNDSFPESLNNIIGNQKAIREIKDAVISARMRETSAPHLLLTGPPGTGKTSISKLISKEMDSNFVYIMGPSVSKKQNIALILLKLEDNDILMIDEIHGLDKAAAETFYNAMLNFELTVIGDDNEVINIPLKKFTLIGATTNPGIMSSILKQRFRQIHITLYSVEELFQILSTYAEDLNITITDDGLMEIAIRSRGTPRIAKNFLSKVRDMVLSRDNRNEIYYTDVIQMFDESNIEPDGCTFEDKLYLDVLKERFNGGPVGLNSLVATLGLDKVYVENEIEPWLSSMGYIERSPRGRILKKEINE